MTLDFESDQFLRLLTDALRAGPGSPEWHEAMMRLGTDGGAAGANEYQLLCRARANLESGKEFRSVRAGPDFTRKVIESIERDDGRSVRRMPTASVIAIIAGLLIVTVVASVIYFLSPRAGSNGADTAAIDHLAATLLGNPVTSASFANGPPADWRIVGKLPLDFTKDMHVRGPKEGQADFAGGGLVWSTPILPDDAFALEAAVRVSHSTEDVLPEVAVSDRPDFSDDNGTGSHEFVWLLQAGQAKVILPDGRLVSQSAKAKGLQNLRITVDRDSAIVEMDGKRLWAGPHGLAPDKPRYLAIRLIRRGNDKQDQVAFKSVRILK